MNKQPKLWEILATILPVIVGIIIWILNLASQVQKHELRIQDMEEFKKEYKQDIKEMKEDIKAILINLQNKADRKNE